MDLETKINSKQTSTIHIHNTSPPLKSDLRWFFSDFYNAPIYISSNHLVGLTNIPANIPADVLHDTFVDAFGDVLFCQLLPPSKAIVCFKLSNSAYAAVRHQSLVILKETITVTSLNRGTPEPLLVASYYMQNNASNASQTSGEHKTDVLKTVVNTDTNLGNTNTNLGNTNTSTNKRTDVDQKQEVERLVQDRTLPRKREKGRPKPTRQRRPSVKDRVLDIEQRESTRKTTTKKTTSSPVVNKTKIGRITKKRNQSKQNHPKTLTSTTFTFQNRSPSLNADGGEGTVLTFMIGDDAAAAVVAESLRLKEKEQEKEHAQEHAQEQAKEAEVEAEVKQVVKQTTPVMNTAAKKRNPIPLIKSTSNSFARERKSTAEEERRTTADGNKNVRTNKKKTKNIVSTSTPTTSTATTTQRSEAKLDDTPKSSKRKIPRNRNEHKSKIDVQNEMQIVQSRKSKRNKKKKSGPSNGKNNRTFRGVSEKNNNGDMSDSSDDLQFFEQTYVKNACKKE